MNSTTNNERAATPRGTGAASTINRGTIPQPAANGQDPEMELWEHVAANMAAVYEFFGMMFGASWTPEQIGQMAQDFASEFMRRRAALLGGAE